MYSYQFFLLLSSSHTLANSPSILKKTHIQMHKRDKWTCLPQPLSALHQSKLFREHSSGNLCKTEGGIQEEKLPSVLLPNFGTSWHGNLRLHEHTFTLKNYSKLKEENEEEGGEPSEIWNSHFVNGTGFTHLPCLGCVDFCRFLVNPCQEALQMFQVTFFLQGS